MTHRLRPWHPEDAAVLYAAVQDEEIARQLPPLETDPTPARTPHH